MRRMLPSDAVDLASMYAYYWEIRPLLKHENKLIWMHAGFDVDHVEYFDDRAQLFARHVVLGRGIVIRVGNESAHDLFWRNPSAITTQAPPGKSWVLFYRDTARPHQFFSTAEEAYSHVEAATFGDFCVLEIGDVNDFADLQAFDDLAYHSEVQPDEMLSPDDIFHYQAGHPRT